MSRMHIRLENGRVRDIVCTTYDSAYSLIGEIRDIANDRGYITVQDVADIMNYDYDRLDAYVGWRGEDLANQDLMQDDSPKGVIRVKLPTSKWLGIAASKEDVPVGEMPKPKEAVNHPDHYQAETGMEVIDVMEAFTFDLKGIEAVDTSNVIKYICRWKKKNGLQDLKKARWYLEHLINHVEKLEKENEYNG